MPNTLLMQVSTARQYSFVPKMPGVDLALARDADVRQQNGARPAPHLSLFKHMCAWSDVS